LKRVKRVRFDQHPLINIPNNPYFNLMLNYYL
jgi:hypothetical protein